FQPFDERPMLRAVKQAVVQQGRGEIDALPLGNALERGDRQFAPVAVLGPLRGAPEKIALALCRLVGNSGHEPVLGVRLRSRRAIRAPSRSPPTPAMPPTQYTICLAVFRSGLSNRLAEA